VHRYGKHRGLVHARSGRIRIDIDAAVIMTLGSFGGRIKRRSVILSERDPSLGISGTAVISWSEQDPAHRPRAASTAPLGRRGKFAVDPHCGDPVALSRLRNGRLPGHTESKTPATLRQKFALSRLPGQFSGLMGSRNNPNGRGLSVALTTPSHCHPGRQPWLLSPRSPCRAGQLRLYPLPPAERRPAKTESRLT